MKTWIRWIPILLLLGCGLNLFVSGLWPLVNEFAALRAREEELAPHILRLLGGVGLLAACRWFLPVGNRPEK